MSPVIWVLPSNLYFFHKKSILKEYWYINKSTSQQYQYHLWLNDHLDYCARGKSYVKVIWSVVWSWPWWLWCVETLATYPSRRKNFEQAAWSSAFEWSSENEIFSMWAQKSTLWQNLPGRMTFWCSSQQIGRAVGQGAFPLLPRYPLSKQAVSHFWPFLLLGIDLGVVILPNSKLLCVLIHGRSCSAWKDLTPLIHHFHFHLSLSLSLCHFRN